MRSPVFPKSRRTIRTIMKLKDYIGKINSEGLDVVFTSAGCEEGTVAAEVLEAEITGLSCDSRTVEPGTLFVCKGTIIDENTTKY